MTQAVNLANFANNLDSSGGVNPSALNAAVPISKGGTNATTAANARTNLGLAIGTDIPSTTGTGASGTWGISISGNAATATSATSATSATNATNATNVTGTIASGVTGTTQSNGDNSAKIATTAYAQNMDLGWGQTWQDVTSSRAFGTTYTNSTGKPISVFFGINSGGATVTVGGVAFPTFSSANNNTQTVASFIVPTGNTYSISGAGLSKWLELR